MEFMDHPFSKSTSAIEKCKKLQEVVSPEDTLAILINADPDSMASALALKRLFWRKIKKTFIYHINTIKRADNLAFVKLLKIDQRHIRDLNGTEMIRFQVHEGYVYEISGGNAPQFIDIDEGSNETIVFDSRPTFNWTEIDGASGYHFQIANDSGFTDLVVNISNINPSTYPDECSIADNVVTFRLPSANQLSDYSAYYTRVRSLG